MNRGIFLSQTLARPLHLAYYADDFTGATDALESLAAAGLRTRLFLEPPTPRQLAQLPPLDAVGVAGLTRSLAPADMNRALQPAFRALRRLSPRHVHYKVCSTFDSSPRVGSIGRAIEIGRSVFGARPVPLLVGAPALGRYCVFGHLFARYGIGGSGAIHRLDRHPGVSRHPVTPMTESDLRLHLARQTKLRCELCDVLALELPLPEARRHLQGLIRRGAAIVLFDAVRPEHLERVGRLVTDLAPARKPLFSVGSSGMGTALSGPRSDKPAGRDKLPRLRAPLLVLSGSCSPVTAGQIEFARRQGFAVVAVGPEPTTRAAATIRAALRAGRNVVACTARGPAAGRTIQASRLGTLLGNLGRESLAAFPVQRLVLAGGDTSSYAARALGIRSVEILARFVPGAPLCRATAPGSPADGLEVNFKGGGVGAADYFVAIAR